MALRKIGSSPLHCDWMEVGSEEEAKGIGVGMLSRPSTRRCCDEGERVAPSRALPIDGAKSGDRWH